MNEEPKPASIADQVSWLRDNVPLGAPISSIRMASVIERLCAHFDHKVHPFQARSVVNVYLLGENSPRKILEMALDELNKMVEPAIFVGTGDLGSVLMQRIGIAIDALQATMEREDFGGASSTREK